MRDDAMLRNVAVVHAMHVTHLVRFMQMHTRLPSPAYCHRRIPCCPGFAQFPLQVLVQFRSSSSSLNRPWLP
ncbi:hypothetical protein R69776_00908 [Paraburkholderia nemoris]|uniref:Uncharacterized protein n=1 Tax=Paraburkholderia nemoris TaxID=2793076 RepID=A0ABN7KUI8_9BURK|nr:hypothetical protein R69776_00908 [Paraburkholderia nemoris]